LSLTLLVDLDDTLLGNKMDMFIPAYLQALSGCLSPYTAPESLVFHLMEATRNMMANNNPDRTLKQTFDAAFYPSLGIEPNVLNPVIEDFYVNVFPSLRNITTQRQDAVTLIQESIRRGYRVIVATNPLFPLTAIHHRLRWAGLAPETYPFTLIPSYESFHFAKPNPAYYAELLGRAGWVDEPVLMIGDDIQMDIQAASSIGLPVFWTPNEPVPNKPPMPCGDIGSVLEWLDNTDVSKLLPDFSNPVAILSVLRSTPAVLKIIFEELPQSDWSRRPETDEWCQTEILCHLRDVEREVNLSRISRLLSDEYPFIASIDTDRWALERDYLHQDGRQALEDFLKARVELLETLNDLPLSKWKIPARHAIFGPTTLQELMNITASHDRLHIQQLKITHMHVRSSYK